MQPNRVALPVLENVRIASPCPAKWSDMVGDDRVRFCGQCEKNVYDLSAMTRDEANALLAASEGSMCARIYRRTDGTILTADCPEGVRAQRKRRLVALTFGAMSLMAAAAFPRAPIAPAMLESVDVMPEPTHQVGFGAGDLPNPVVVKRVKKVKPIEPIELGEYAVTGGAIAIGVEGISGTAKR